MKKVIFFVFTNSYGPLAVCVQKIGSTTLARPETEIRSQRRQQIRSSKALERDIGNLTSYPVPGIHISIQ